MKLKHINILVVIANLVVILSIVTPFILSLDLNDAGAVGIIGGADGPTAIFITGKFISRLPFALLIVTNIVVLILNIVKKLKNRRLR